MPRSNSTAIPDTNGSPQAAAVALGVLAAYADEGYLKEDGTGIDTAKVRAKILEVVREHKVLTWKDRATKAIRRGDVVRAVFPSLPAPPDGFSETEDPQLAKAVWGKVYGDMWLHLSVSATSALQQLVGASMGNGYVLVRTSLDSPRPDAVYITDDRTCIDRDLRKPENDAAERKIRSVLATVSMLAMRQPENAKHYAKGGNDFLRHLQVSGRDQIALAVASASGNGDEPGDEPGGDE